ncbi:MAG: hypothetical protein NTZ78_01180 [Candidatus Aureabacteria bacterium]|nr:hypothetical protein [Candidatus Auribacterota bacterium]
MKNFITAALSLLFAACLSYPAIAGSLDSPGAPSAGSGMYSLQNLYEYIVSGVALEEKTSFQEPTAAPGSTMKTTKEIGDALKASYDQCDVTVDDVRSGKKFFSTMLGSWGVQTGTGLMQPTPTSTPTATPTPTITPTTTPTPTWGQTRCEAKGGYWANDGLGSNGCWFLTFSEQLSCDGVCDSVGLRCTAGDWNDDEQCSVCKHLKGAGSYCQDHDYPSAVAPFGCPDGRCYGRAGGTSKSCSAPSTSDWYPLCVCLP